LMVISIKQSKVFKDKTWKMDLPIIIVTIPMGFS
jgi:hypothetical protein